LEKVSEIQIHLKECVFKVLNASMSNVGQKRWEDSEDMM
jgi:hypothetical protein